MYNVVYIETLLKVLRCVCYWCSKLLIDVDAFGHMRSTNQRNKLRKRLAAVTARCKLVRACPHCRGAVAQWSRAGVAVQRDFQSVPPSAFATDEEMAFAARETTSSDVHSILDNISREDERALGFSPHSRPVYMLFTIFPVPPVIMRPSIASSESSRTRGHDDLTIKLQDITKASNALRAVVNDVNSDSIGFLRAFDVLQCHVALYLTNDLRAQTSRQAVSQSNGANGARAARAANLRSLSARLRGKRGRIRANLSGKRIDYSSRTVVGPDTSLDVDELGVPEDIAISQTRAIRVCSITRSVMRECVRRGVNTRGGAASITCADGRNISLSVHDAESRAELAENIQDGDVVHRYLKNGDYVLFNRQPSLHMFSIMAHRIVILPGYTFRLNPMACAPYNADFDGDEMNMHVVQDVLADAEGKHLMRVSENLISPQHSEPTLKIIQDVVLALYLLTAPEFSITWDEAAHIIASLRHCHEPTRFIGCAHEDGGTQRLVPPLRLVDAVIPQALCFNDRGFVVSNGRCLSGRINKGVCASLVSAIARDFGGDTGCKFISEIQRLGNAVLMLHGASCSVNDCRTRTVQQARDRLHEAFDGIAPTSTEGEIQSTLQLATDRCATSALSGVDTGNNFCRMIACGSKGTIVNSLQITAVVGQQTVMGRRLCLNMRRPLPCFVADEASHPRVHGYVESSYYDGLQPYEFFFHLAGGREGLVDTAVKTAKTGYLTRKLSKLLETYTVRHDGSVRNSAGDILSYAYGGDALCSEELELVSCAGLSSDRASWGDANNALLNAGYAFALWMRTCKLVFTPNPEPQVIVPLNIRRWLLRLNGGMLGGAGDVASTVAELCAQLAALPLPGAVHVVWELRNVVDDLDVVSRAVREMRRAYMRARAPSGYSPGVVAAQSLGNPITQMTLNSACASHPSPLTRRNARPRTQPSISRASATVSCAQECRDSRNCWTRARCRESRSCGSYCTSPCEVAARLPNNLRAIWSRCA